MLTRSAILAAAVGAAIASAPALAADTSAIRYSDLDLTSEQGKAELDRRVDKAARDACGYNDQLSGTRLNSSKSKACLKSAKASAHKQIADRMARSEAAGG